MFAFPPNSQETVQRSNSSCESQSVVKICAEKCDETSHVSRVLSLLQWLKQLKNARVTQQQKTNVKTKQRRNVAALTLTSN